jgi:hypothetical protein
MLNLGNYDIHCGQKYYPDEMLAELNWQKPTEKKVKYYENKGINIKKKIWGRLLKEFLSIIDNLDKNLPKHEIIQTLVSHIEKLDESFIDTWVKGIDVENVGSAYFKDIDDLLRFKHLLNNPDKYKDLKIRVQDIKLETN